MMLSTFVCRPLGVYTPTDPAPGGEKGHRAVSKRSLPLTGVSDKTLKSVSFPVHFREIAT